MPSPPVSLPVPLDVSAAIDVGAIDLTPLPLHPSRVISGTPETSYAVLDTSADGRVERGIWQHTPGVTTDVEADELFVVVSGQATVAIEGGDVLELSPGLVGILRAGARTTWAVTETLRKVFQTTA